MAFTASDTRSDAENPVVVGFLLIPDFALMSYASAVEPLRAANVLSGRNLYRWWHATPGHRPVVASNGIAVLPNVPVGDLDHTPDLLLVCAGGNPTTFSHRPTIAWLRQLARRGVTIGGISGGPYILARAGLLSGRRCTLHWDHVPAFQEAFPDIKVTQSLYEIDGDRITCSGGIAALDMMVALMARMRGYEFAARVGEWFVHTQLREGGGSHRMNLRMRHGIADERLAGALRVMEDNLERPVVRSRLARGAGVSVRQLERLFRDHLGRSIHRHYLDLRLAHARRLLTESGMPVLSAALGSGFASASQFSRAYRRRYGQAPSRTAVPMLAAAPPR
ncbi:MAG: GlxA family transcriptional regulator [Pseudorhodoplanes sp.]